MLKGRCFKWLYHHLIYIIKNLPVKFRGYDEDEVNEFLEQIMKDYENVLEENKTLKRKFETIERTSFSFQLN